MTVIVDLGVVPIGGACRRAPLSYKKDPLQCKESERMEPSGLEPLTPCMPCRCSTS